MDSPADALAVLKAHLHFWTNLRAAINKRKLTKITWLEPKPVNNQIYENSIVIDYFIRRKKTFSELNFNQRQ
jgi:hypothetical protein